MRRIYESEALKRDDEPFTPYEEESGGKLESFRSINSTKWSRRLIPQWLARRSISITVDAPGSAQAGQTVPFSVQFRNPLPFPITLRTRSPVLWQWSIDGVPEASRVPRDEPDTAGSFTLGRGQRKQFRRHWNGHFKIATDEWEPAEPGEYTLRVAINVDAPDASGLADEVQIRLE